MGLPAEEIPGCSVGAGKSDLWERRDGGALRARGEEGAEGRPAGRSVLRKAGERDGGRDGFGRGKAAAARPGDAAGPRGTKAGPPA